MSQEELVKKMQRPVTVKHIWLTQAGTVPANVSIKDTLCITHWHAIMTVYYRQTPYQVIPCLPALLFRQGFSGVDQDPWSSHDTYADPAQWDRKSKRSCRCSSQRASPSQFLPNRAEWFSCHWSRNFNRTKLTTFCENWHFHRSFRLSFPPNTTKSTS